MRKTKNHTKKFMSVLGTIAFMGTVTALMGCAGTVDRQAEAKNYTVAGRITEITTEIKTADGNLWSYDAEVFEYEGWKSNTGEICFIEMPEKEITPDYPVYVEFSDNGTPEILEDDIIIRVGYDFNTYMDECIARNDEWIRKHCK